MSNRDYFFFLFAAFFLVAFFFGAAFFLAAAFFFGAAFFLAAAFFFGAAFFLAAFFLVAFFLATETPPSKSFRIVKINTMLLGDQSLILHVAESIPTRQPWRTDCCHQK